MTRALRYLAPALTVAATVALWSGAASATGRGRFTAR
jgi:hypothetical protein